MPLNSYVIFDMDGTLINSGGDITTSVNHVRKTVYGLEPLTVDYVVEVINRDNRNLAELFYQVSEYEPEAKKVFEAHYHRQCVQTPRLYSGIESLLSGLTSLGVRLSVATNAPGQFAEKMLEHLGIAHRFDRIVGSEHVKESKPHPAMLNLILEGYGYVPGHDFALMVGDNGKDMESARRAGIPGAFVTWGFSSQGLGECICAHPDELLALVEARGRKGGEGAILSPG